MKPHATHTLIDDLTVYRYALPAEQIALAAEGKPVTYRPALPISVEPRPAQGRWRVEVDGTGHVGEDGAGTAIRVDVLAAGAPTPNRVYATARIEKFDDSLGRTTLECARIPAGACLVRATVLDAAGKEVARSEVPFTKPPDAPWAGNRIGLEERVLPPFTAIRVGGGGRVGERESGRVGDGAGSRRRSADKGDSAAAECWGRRYALGGPFPTQIESAGQGMLAAPVEVVAATDAGPVLFKKGAGKTTAWSATRARRTGSAEAVGLKLETRSTLEYDGLLWTDVTLTPKAPVTLTEVTLRIPVRAANALYLHHARGSWGEDTAGALPAAGYESAAIVPSLWVGDDDRGLAWLAETQQGWSNAAGKPLQFVARKGDVVEMRIQVVNQPTKVEGPLRFSFGLQATPVKPRPAGARGWRLGNLGDAPTLSQPSMGTIQVIWSNGLLAQYGYPWPADPEKFRKIVADLHARKNLAVPYVNLNYFSAGAPEWAYYSPDFRDPSRSFTDGDVGAMGHATIGACPHSPAWRDLIAYKIARFVEEFQVDGIYVDCWNPFPCTNEEHGCGWRDAAGNLHGNFGLRDYREIVRRVRALLAERRPNFHIIIHMSSDVVIPMLAFADSMLDGEQYQGDKTPKDDYLAVLPLDKWRAENTGIQWGVFPFFLPELAGEHRRTTVPTERLMGLMLAHDTSPWPIWCNESVIFGAWKTVDRFGIVDAEFLPYWKPNGVTTDNAEVLVSAYRKPGRALLVVLNSGKADAHVALKVDPKPLSLKPAFAAAGAADDAVLSPDGRALTLDVPARGYRLVVLK